MSAIYLRPARSHGSDHDSSTHGSSSASSHASDDSHATSSHGDSSHGDSSHGASDHGSEPNVFVLGSYFDYDTFVVLLSIVGCCAMVRVAGRVCIVRRAG